MSKFIDTREILATIGVRRALPPSMLRAIERATGIARLSTLCTSVGVTRSNADVPSQIRAVMAAAGIRYTVSGPGLRLVPRSGAVIFYANHPFGIADALIGLEVALAARADTKVLANSALSALDINRDRLIWINPFDGHSRSDANRRGLRRALQHLRDGGALLMFPAGACAHLQPRAAGITDPPWSQHLVRFAVATEASPVPLHFAGHNSWFFQIAGLAHPMVRTLLLLREFMALEGRHIDVRAGSPLVVGAAAGRSAEEETQRLRAVVYDLGRTADSAGPGLAP
jgi:putative hemolysin